MDVCLLMVLIRRRLGKKGQHQMLLHSAVHLAEMFMS